jgi:hypothetical protein
MRRKISGPYSLFAYQFAAISLVAFALFVLMTRTPPEEPPACTLGSAEALFTNCRGSLNEETEGIRRLKAPTSSGTILLSGNTNFRSGSERAVGARRW